MDAGIIKVGANDHGSDFSKFYSFALWLDKILILKLLNFFFQNH